MQPPSASYVHILVADQDALLCVSARRALHKLGYSTTIAHDGADVLARFAPETHNVVIVGVSLQPYDGLQILNEIKKRSPDTEVILLSDAQSVESAISGLGTGAFAYLLTPIEDFRQLQHTVERALELQRLRRQAQTQPTTPVSEEDTFFFSTAAAPTQDIALPVAAPAPDEEDNLVGPNPLHLLGELIESLRATKSLPEILQLLAEVSAHLLQAEHAAVLLPHAESGMQLSGTYGFSDHTVAARRLMKQVGEEFARRVANERKTIIDTTPILAEGQTPIQFVGTPQRLSEQVLGILIVYPLPVQPIAPARLVWLEAFAAQGAYAIQLERLAAENARLTTSDPVTGALKRDVFVELADHEFRRSWRYNQPIAIIILDVDGMKEINRRSGREFGDQVLHQVAGACRHALRSIDLVGRYENDALALLLLMTGRDGAKNAADRLRTEIGSIELSDVGGPVRITATLGVSAYPREGCTSIFDLLAIAQEAQLAARRIGPNQIVYA